MGRRGLELLLCRAAGAGHVGPDRGRHPPAVVLPAAQTMAGCGRHRAGNRAVSIGVEGPRQGRRHREHPLRGQERGRQRHVGDLLDRDGA